MAKPISGTKLLACILLCALFCSNATQSYKILVVYPMPSMSHYTIGLRVVKELVARGHEVFVINPFPRNPPIKNLTDVSVESLVSFIPDDQKNEFYDIEKMTLFNQGRFITEVCADITEEVLKHKNVQKLLKSDEKFDLLILPQYANEAFLALAHRFQAPIVLISTMPLYAWGSYLLAKPSPSSYVPNLMSPYTGEMTFWQRFMNTYYDLSIILYHQLVILPKHREIAKKYIPGQPDLNDYLHNHSLTLLNSHVSIYDPIPSVPNAIDIGGFHVTPPQELPEDIKKFIEGSKNGVILFAMGSNLKSVGMSSEKKEAILNVLSGLKQNILWKFETEELGTRLPKNVKIGKWLPQQDILAHPNVRAFISHGGLLSTIEAVHHGVPIVGIPLFVDQKMNMAAVVTRGYGVLVPYQELTEENLSHAINEVLNVPKYKENVQKYSRIMQDQPLKPLDSAMYWIEYVIRHKGALHLKHGGLKLLWYQRYSLDVAAVAMLILLAALGTVYCVLLNTVSLFKNSMEKVKTN